MNTDQSSKGQGRGAGSASDSVYGKCYRCGTATGAYAAYCADCVAKQAAEWYGGSELAAFNAYHSIVDALTKEES